MAALTIAAAGPEPAFAKDPFPGIIGQDDRRIVDSWEPPWNAIGKVNTPAYRRLGECTGTLVRGDIVVTAAHCLINEISGKPFRDQDIHFSAGLRRDRRIGHATARCVRFPEGYRFEEPLGDGAGDYAFVVLDSAIDTPPLSLIPRGRLRTGNTVTHAGYGRDRRFLPVAHRGCTVTGLHGAWVFTDCDTNHGQSGGPLIVETEGAYFVAGIMSATVPGVHNRAAAVYAGIADLDRIRQCD